MKISLVRKRKRENPADTGKRIAELLNAGSLAVYEATAKNLSSRNLKWLFDLFGRELNHRRGKGIIQSAMEQYAHDCALPDSQED